MHSGKSLNFFHRPALRFAKWMADLLGREIGHNFEATLASHSAIF
jgi:hypothetical protein